MLSMTRRTSASYGTRLSQANSHGDSSTCISISPSDMMHRSSTGKMGGGNNTDLERFSNGDTTKRESSRKR